MSPTMPARGRLPDGLGVDRRVRSVAHPVMLTSENETKVEAAAGARSGAAEDYEDYAAAANKRGPAG